MQILKITFLLSLLTCFSCKKSEPNPITTPVATPSYPTVDCDSIAVRQDGLQTFYESNPTYFDNQAADLSFELNSPYSQGMDSILIYQGLNVLEDSPTVLSCMIFRSGNLIAERYYDGSNESSSNNVHSASKSIITAAIGVAIEKNQIQGIDQPILDFFPDYNNTDPLKENITIEHLLTMQSGLQWTEDWTEYSIENEPNWVNAILDLPLASNPGETFNYSTGNTHLLSAILTKTAGTSTCEFVQNELLGPMGIAPEHWGQDPQGYSSGGYNFYLSARELAQIGLVFMDNGWLGEKELIPQNWVADCLDQQVVLDAEWDYGYGWWGTTASGVPVKIAWGYGGQYICIVPQLDILVVSTANTAGVYNQLDVVTFLEEYVLAALL